MRSNVKKILLVIVMIIVFGNLSFSAPNSKALILQEMSWVEVKDYLKTNRMVIIPLGSTEQHGPHLPLGTDYYEAMEQVLFETVQMLMKYGFDRFMFFNYHGGNNIVQSKIIHRVNHTTEGIAIAIGHGSSLQQEADEDEDFFDWHSGKNETSIMLYLRPDLVRMDRAKKPVITFTPKMKELRELAKKHPELFEVWSALLGVPISTKKGGASHELSSNGIWSFSDPNEATKKIGEKTVNKMVKKAVKFIRTWKLAKK